MKIPTATPGDLITSVHCVQRGILPDNPICHCPINPFAVIRSRAQIAGLDDNKVIPRALHFKCAVGRCDFFRYFLDNNGEVVTLPLRTLHEQEMVEVGL
jgi:hypothetical protein